jgi:hypothetical protein
LAKFPEMMNNSTFQSLNSDNILNVTYTLRDIMYNGLMILDKNIEIHNGVIYNKSQEN